MLTTGEVARSVIDELGTVGRLFGGLSLRWMMREPGRPVGGSDPIYKWVLHQLEAGGIVRPRGDGSYDLGEAGTPERATYLNRAGAYLFVLEDVLENEAA